MSQSFIEELIFNLKRLNKSLKKEVIMNNENATLLRDIMTDIVNLSGKVENFIINFKMSKNSKKLELLMKDQYIHEKVVEKFIPAMIAYSILLRCDGGNDDGNADEEHLDENPENRKD